MLMMPYVLEYRCVSYRALLLPFAVDLFLLLFVIVCWMATFFADSLNLVRVFSCSSFKRDLLVMVPLGSTVSHLRPTISCVLGDYGHARSQGGHQPAAAKLPLY